MRLKVLTAVTVAAGLIASAADAKVVVSSKIDTEGGVLGNILGAEEDDEFFGKLIKGATNIIKKAAPVVGQIARGAAPILGMIPHPAAQVAGQVANVLGKLKAEVVGPEADRVIPIWN